MSKNWVDERVPLPEDLKQKIRILCQNVHSPAAGPMPLSSQQQQHHLLTMPQQLLGVDGMPLDMASLATHDPAALAAMQQQQHEANSNVLAQQMDDTTAAISALQQQVEAASAIAEAATDAEAQQVAVQQEHDAAAAILVRQPHALFSFVCLNSKNMLHLAHHVIVLVVQELRLRD